MDKYDISFTQSLNGRGWNYEVRKDGHLVLSGFALGSEESAQAEATNAIQAMHVATEEVNNVGSY